MADYETIGKEVAKGAGELIARLALVVVALILMVVGVAMGVSIVLLPIGVPLGIFGLFLLFYALFGWTDNKQATAPPPGPQ